MLRFPEGLEALACPKWDYPHCTYIMGAISLTTPLPPNDNSQTPQITHEENNWQGFVSLKEAEQGSSKFLLSGLLDYLKPTRDSEPHFSEKVLLPPSFQLAGNGNVVHRNHGEQATISRTLL